MNRKKFVYIVVDEAFVCFFFHKMLSGLRMTYPSSRLCNVFFHSVSVRFSPPRLRNWGMQLLSRTYNSGGVSAQGGPRDAMVIEGIKFRAGTTRYLSTSVCNNATRSVVLYDKLNVKKKLRVSDE